MSIYIHPTATVEEGAFIGESTRIYHYSHVRKGARLGAQCIVGGHVYIDSEVVVGNRCKIQSAALLYHGLTVEDGVFIGPGARFANDLYPRAINPDGSLKGAEDWVVSPTLIKQGASIGMGAMILSGVTIGQWAMVGMGAVVVKDVPDYGLVVGNPAKLIGYVDEEGRRKA
jgi:acetyltransferase-like isoleucine patch superfamily enzyme